MHLLLAGCINFSYYNTTVAEETCLCWIASWMKQGGASFAVAFWGLRHSFVHRCSVAMAVLYILGCLLWVVSPIAFGK